MTRTDAILSAVRQAVESKRAWVDADVNLRSFRVHVRMTSAGVVRCVLVECLDEIVIRRPSDTA